MRFALGGTRWAKASHWRPGERVPLHHVEIVAPLRAVDAAADAEQGRNGTQQHLVRLHRVAQVADDSDGAVFETRVSAWRARLRVTSHDSSVTRTPTSSTTSARPSGRRSPPAGRGWPSPSAATVVRVCSAAGIALHRGMVAAKPGGIARWRRGRATGVSRVQSRSSMGSSDIRDTPKRSSQLVLGSRSYTRCVPPCCSVHCSLPSCSCSR